MSVPNLAPDDDDDDKLCWYIAVDSNSRHYCDYIGVCSLYLRQYVQLSRKY